MRGRDAELATLDLWLAEGHAVAQAVLVAGEAGLGKTTLLAELADRASATGRRVLRARGIATGATPPFWMWSQLLGDREADVADRFAFVDRVLGALRAEAPAMVVVDDVQWVDESSLRTLALVVSRLGGTDVLVALSLRTHDELEGWRTAGEDLLAAAQPLRVDLAPLTDDVAAQCLRLAAGHDLPPQVVEQALALARGNPFYLTELGRTSRSSGALTVPAVVSEVIGRRVARLSPSAQELLHVAAVLGDTTDIAVAARCLGRDPLECLPAVQESLDASLLEREGSAVRFAHPLVRTALLASLSLQRLVALHRRAAVEIEDLYADGLDDHAANLARLWSEVVVTGEREPAVRWARRAADIAFAALAFEDASRFYSLALDSGGPALDDRTRAGLLRDRAVADLRAGRMPEADAGCRDATTAARRTGDARLLASVALALDAIGVRTWDRPIRDRCEESLELLDGDDPALRAQLLSRLSHCLMYDGDWAGAASTSAEALRWADISDDDEARLAAYRARQLAASGPDGHDERVELATRMTALGERLDRPDVEMWGRLWTIDTRWEVGDLSAVATETSRLQMATERVGGPVARWHLLVARAVLSQAQGQFDDARAIAGEAADLLRSTGHPGWFGGFMALLAGIGHHRGHEPIETDPPEGQEGDPGETRSALFGYLGPAVNLAENGRLDDARLRYRAAGPPRTWDIPPFFEISALAATSMIAIELGDLDDVAFVHDRLSPWRGRHLVGGAGVGNYFGPVELALGRCSATMGDLDQAESDLREARAICDAIGVPGFGAECDVELADVLRRSGRSDEATTLLDHALVQAQRLGMTRFVTRIAAMQATVETRRTSGDDLTAREVEVARLVAQGQSNREIAATLVLSERTAANHVQHVLTKLGMVRRAQIAAWWPRSEYADE